MPYTASGSVCRHGRSYWESSKAWSWVSLVAKVYSPSYKLPFNARPITEFASTRKPRRAYRTFTPLCKIWCSTPLKWPKSCLLTPYMPVVVMQPSLAWAGSGSPLWTRTIHSIHHTSGRLRSHHRYNGSWSQQPTHWAPSPIQTSNLQGPLHMRVPWPTTGISGNAQWPPSLIILQPLSGGPRPLSPPRGPPPTCSTPRVYTSGAITTFYNTPTSWDLPTCSLTSLRAILTCPMMLSYAVSPLSLLMHRTGRC